MTCHIQDQIIQLWCLSCQTPSLASTLLLFLGLFSLRKQVVMLERLTQRGTEHCSWPTASEELKLSVQKPMRKWILPTIMWVSLEMYPSPVDLEMTTTLANILPPVRDSEAEEPGNLTWVPDPQQIWGDKCCCFKPLGFGSNWLLYWKELIQQAWAAQTWTFSRKSCL